MLKDTTATTLPKTPPIGRFDQLKSLAMRGAMWTFFGYGSRQVVRFINKLIITRLVMPELMGLMALINIFMQGLELFSDIGINPSIIQNKRGEEPVFLDTAWTVQVIRGVMLWLVAVILAWPLASWYGEPILRVAFPVAALTAVFAGLRSTKLAAANRKLMMRELTLVEVTAYVLGLCVMIIWAYINPSIWALIAGGIVTMFLETVFSHVFLKGHRNKLHWDREVFDEIYRFGRWIFFSTAMTFLVRQSDRLILGRLLDLTFLGVYGIAAMLARMFDDAILQMGYRVLFPSYARLYRENPQRLYITLRKARFLLITLSWVGASMFILFGDNIIDLLYNDNYARAGWMLRIMACGTLVGVVGLTYDNVLVAIGQTFVVAGFNTLQLIFLVLGIFLGVRWGGELGVLIGLASAAWLIYPFKAFWLARLKLWQPEIDLPFVSLATLFVLALAYFT